MTTVWGIPNIKEIGIASFNGKYWLIDPTVFNNVVANKNINGGVNKAPKKDGRDYDPVSGYEIHQDKLSDLSRGIINFDGYNTESITRSDCAWHKNANDKMGDFTAWDNSTVTGKYTEFYKLFWKDCKNFTSKGFKCFNRNCTGGLEFDAKNWIYVDLENESYTGYLRIFYRTWDDFYTIINCDKNNFELSSYNKYPECKTYIDKNKSILHNKCNNQQLRWGDKDNIDTCTNWCMISNNQPNCKDSIKPFCNDKNNITTPFCKDWCMKNSPECDQGAINYCKIHLDDTTFCGCFDDNMRNIVPDDLETLLYGGNDSYGNNNRAICWSKTCADGGYMTQSMKILTDACPECYQVTANTKLLFENVDSSKINTNIIQSCNISKNTPSNTTNPPNGIASSPNNTTSSSNNITSSSNDTTIKKSLFQIKNSNIKTFIENLNLETKFPIEYDYFLLNEEDLFILLCILLIILIFIIYNLFIKKQLSRKKIFRKTKIFRNKKFRN